MIVEIGHFALVMALVVTLLQTVLPAWGAHRNDSRLMAFASPAAMATFALLLLSFLCLTVAYVRSDFSVLNVATNSHTTKPLIYKISGVWGNHEGSMLLWVLILALFGAAVVVFGNNLPTRLKALVIAVQGSVAAAFCLFLVVASNPFLRVDPPPFDGNGLNPILQDPALAFHPPFLYVGYVGFSMAFSFAIAALIEGRTDAAWARWVRPWTLAAWMCLTLGIAMGSWWAYYELGWGGWWFWDPVENASFMPWLAGTALLHSALVMEKREALKVWTILLAILTFSLSLMGTFLVRSGVLTSVHAFAVDPKRGVFILSIMTVFIGGGLALFAARASSLRQGGLFSPISREGGLVLNNILLTTACATVLVGTLYPLLLEAVTGGQGKISVGAPYFNMTFVPLMVPLLMAVPFGPFLAWKRADVAAAAQRLIVAAIVAALALALSFAVYARGPWLAPFGIAIGVFVMGGAIADLAFRAKLGRVPFEEARRRFFNLPRSVHGTALAHFGVGLMVVGITATSAWRVEDIRVMKPGDTSEIAGWQIAFRGVSPERGANYRSQVGRFDIMRGGKPVATLDPAKRVYDAPPMPTTEAGILPSWRGDLYVVMGDEQPGGAWSVRVYFNPLVRFIWIGAVIMFLAGGLSLMDRRLRVGAPQQARGRSLPQAAE